MGTGTALRRGRQGVAGVLVVAACAPCLAGTIFGTLYRDGRLWAGANMLLACPGRPDAPAATDGRGAYRLTVPHSGPCVLRVADASLEVVVFDQPPTQVDLTWTSGPPPALQRR